MSSSIKQTAAKWGAAAGGVAAAGTFSWMSYRLMRDGLEADPRACAEGMGAILSMGSPAVIAGYAINKVRRNKKDDGQPVQPEPVDTFTAATTNSKTI